MRMMSLKMEHESGKQAMEGCNGAVQVRAALPNGYLLRSILACNVLLIRRVHCGYYVQHELHDFVRPTYTVVIVFIFYWRLPVLSACLIYAVSV